MINVLRNNHSATPLATEAQPHTAAPAAQHAPTAFLPMRTLKAAVSAATLAALCKPAQAQSGSAATGLLTGLIIGAAIDGDYDGGGPTSKGDEIMMWAIIGSAGAVVAGAVGIGLWLAFGPSCGAGFDSVRQSSANAGRAVGRSLSAVYQGVAGCCKPRGRTAAPDVEMGQNAPTRPRGAAPVMPMPLQREPMVYG